IGALRRARARRRRGLLHHAHRGAGGTAGRALHARRPAPDRLGRLPRTGARAVRPLPRVRALRPPAGARAHRPGLDSGAVVAPDDERHAAADLGKAVVGWTRQHRRALALAAHRGPAKPAGRPTAVAPGPSLAAPPTGTATP